MIQPWRYPHLFQLWQDWLQQGQEHQLDQWLKQWFKAHKQYGKKDRKSYADALFNAMRYLSFALYAELQYSDSSVSLSSIEPAKFWYWILLRSQASTVAPRELSDADNRQTFYLSLKSHSAQQDLLSEAYLAWHGLEAHWAKHLAARTEHSEWTDLELHSFIEAQNQPVPLWLRAQQIHPEQLQAALQSDGIRSQLQPIADGHLAIRIDTDVDLSKLDLYQQGKLEVQDAASQCLAYAVTANSEQTVWEPCAGAGGKSLAIASHTGAKVTATDIRANAIKQAQKRAARAGLINIDFTVADATQTTNKTFDWVFIDAPCSSSGVWRRSPDAKHRLSADTELLNLQAKILNNGANHVAVNGYLIYATCSWLTEENERQIAKFMSENPNFSIENQLLVGCPSQNSDTMWFAKLKRLS